MLLCKTIDLDLEKESEVLANARETVEYLQNVITAIETRVLSGEKINGLQIIAGAKRRFITDVGFKYLANLLGKDVVYKTITKPIGVTELDNLLPPQELLSLQGKGVIGYETGKPKVIVE
jgi:hypothetical protein